jgi:phenylpropionate dioxygenase-like ring-hydroxylating dioxygenase large terminal subunit
MFLCHQNDIPEDHWRVYPQFRDWAVANRDGTIGLIGNICQHQGSYLAGGKGQGDRICPYHGWQYNMKGHRINTGNAFCQETADLPTKTPHKFFDFITSEQLDVDINELGKFINTGHLRLVETRIDLVKTNWKNIINLFLDVDHIPVLHPGVYQEISANHTSDLTWIYGTNSNIQLVPKTTVNNEFESTLLDSDHQSMWSATWITLYPYTMMEYQPGAWFITVCVPQGVKETSVIVYKYRDTRYNNTNWEINNRIWELAWKQDRTQSEMMSNWMPPDHCLEEQKLHFRHWLSNNVTDLGK